jgi:hypothetical protein
VGCRGLVPDVEFGVAVVGSAQFDEDRAAVGAPFDRVVDEVGDGPVDGVGIHLSQAFLDVELNPTPLVVAVASILVRSTACCVSRSSRVSSVWISTLV